MAALNARQGQLERAALLCSAATRFRVNSQPRPGEQRADDADPLLRDLREQLDPAAFECAWNEGQVMPEEAAVALASSDS